MNDPKAEKMIVLHLSSELSVVPEAYAWMLWNTIADLKIAAAAKVAEIKELRNQLSDLQERLNRVAEIGARTGEILTDLQKKII